MARMKYVQRRANRFEFRFHLAGKPIPPLWPEALAPFVNAHTGRFKIELIRSLQTADAKAAERKVLGHIAEAHALVDQARTFLRQGPAARITPNRLLPSSVSTRSRCCMGTKRSARKELGSTSRDQVLPFATTGLG